MKREIKFRGWDQQAKEWNDNYSTKKGNREHLPLPEMYDWQMLQEYSMDALVESQFDIMQFTGLTDCNGVDIYEGDIVKWGHLAGSYEVPTRVAKVEINPDIQFVLLNGKHTFRFGNFSYKKTELALEIIGNIHENPELLK